MQIQFLGATQTVTGSKYLLRTKQTTILVDCGLFQGYKELRLRNWLPFPVSPKDIHTVLLTHAHIDHSGYIPLLIKNGFTGKIICSVATYDLCKILLPDSGHLQEEEARYMNLKGVSKHHPALPLYTREDAEFALRYFETTPFEKTVEIGGARCCFYYGGHILGASLVRVEADSTSILFTGDLGRPNDPILYPPKDPPDANYFVIESTYGGRPHSDVAPQDLLETLINKTAKRGGVVLIPSFAVGRAQLVLYYLHQLKIQNRIPNIPIFVDSPMATDATKIFYQYANEHRLSAEETESVCRIATYIHSVEESKALNDKNVPMIIISASGMATGGRILHHIKNFGPNHRNTIIFCGYQAGGTRGDLMMRGTEYIKILGQMVKINAEIAQLENISAHVDYQEMLDWLRKIKKLPRKIFITHGEDNASQSLKEKIEKQLGFPCFVPQYQYMEKLV